MSEPTDAAADYLMTIRYMRGEGQPVIAARLAERMGFSAATVSEMVNRLAREGLLSVDEVTRQLELTEAGRAGVAKLPRRATRQRELAERFAAIRVGIPGARNASFDIVRASSHSSAKTSHSGTVWTTLGATPVSAAAAVLWISFPRSTARSSVSAPGIRTK
jgi:DNA-binding transcriptional regulator PaaX